MRKKDIVFSGMMGAILLSLGTADAVAADGAVSIASTKYVENRLSAKQDALTAGSDISIADGVIGVLTADSVVADSTAPVQSGAVAAALAGKADASTTYTKTQVDELIDGVDTSEAVLEFGELKTTIGDTTALTTANKDSIVGAINSLQSTKADASALTDYAKTSDLGALATKDTVSVDQIAAGAIGTAQLSESVVVSLGKADTALQESALEPYATTESVTTALTPYAKSEDVTQEIATATTGMLTEGAANALYAPIGDYATKTELAGKADASTTYTKTQVDELIDGVDTSEAVLEFGELKTTIGDTTALTTANKDSIVGAINSLQSTKADASALTDYAKTSDLGALATKDTVSVDQIAAGAIGTAQLSESVVVSLSKADTALQESALTSYAKSADVTTEIAEATSGLLSKSLADSVYAPIGDYATTGYVDTTETDAVNAAKAYTDEKTTGMLTETAANELYATAEQGTTADRVAGLVDSETTGLDATYNLAVAAIPRPDADCTTSKTCVLSVNANGAPYWIELTDDSTN